MAKPLIPAEAIYERALELLDAEGTEALSTRRLAADLRISTRTLYQQVGNREQLIRALVARHFSLLRLEFHEHEDWETTAVQWCLALHDALRAHPYLTELMTIDDRSAVMDYVHEMVNATLREGIPPLLAVDCCRALVNMTINHTIVEVRGLREPRLSERSEQEFEETEENFRMSIRWLLAGVRADAKPVPRKAPAAMTARRSTNRRNTIIDETGKKKATG
ncbi:TetR family transcriptional regulator [Nocardia vinacea]|uniref:TetR family transcriptional regulator n=1 Tax=Nocardia vinacea TaxID=96468 RepID=A0ABZ1YRA8_9NOCA|nr:TetR family transcriptional regulator [Nocardia vinacea]